MRTCSLLSLLVVAVAVVTTQAAAKKPAQVTCGSLCNGVDYPCSRGDGFDLAIRLMSLNTTADNAVCSPSRVKYCPSIDAFAALRMRQPLNNSVVANCSKLVLQLYYNSTLGAGVPFPSPNFPLKDDGYRGTEFLCSDAVVDLLIFNLTITKGRFISVKDNSSFVNTGFMSTCDKNGVCLFNADSPCVGGTSQGKFGFCAMCPSEYKNMTVDSMDPQVYLTWYGTDTNGNTMTSGGLNPIKFRQYSGANVYQKISSVGSRLVGGL